jgi:hypothetical protein
MFVANVTTIVIFSPGLMNVPAAGQPLIEKRAVSSGSFGSQRAKLHLVICSGALPSFVMSMFLLCGVLLKPDAPKSATGANEAEDPAAALPSAVFRHR